MDNIIRISHEVWHTYVTKLWSNLISSSSFLENLFPNVDIAVLLEAEDR